jgi:hypothetical protein
MTCNMPSAVSWHLYPRAVDHASNGGVAGLGKLKENVGGSQQLLLSMLAKTGKCMLLARRTWQPAA